MKRVLAVCMVLTALCVVVFAAPKKTVVTKPAAPKVSTIMTGARSPNAPTVTSAADELAPLKASALRYKRANDMQNYAAAIRRLEAARSAREMKTGTRLPAETADMPRRTVTMVGDNCASPFPLTVPSTSFGTTCGFTDDYYFACPPWFGGLNGLDVAYSYTPPVDQLVTFDLCQSTFDTKIYIYDGVCTGDPMICNDDFCGLQSRLECVALLANHTYYVVVDAYGAGDSTGTCGDYTLVTSLCAQSCVQCPPNSIPENEPACYDNYIDITNGGCNSTPPVFGSIACGQTVCGTAGNYLVVVNDTLTENWRDTDWYELVLTAPANVTATVVADFPVQLLIIQPPCEAMQFPGSITGDSCVPVSITVPLTAGTWWIWVGPSVFEGYPCGLPYYVSVECGPYVPIGRCCYTSPTAGIPLCEMISEIACTELQGTWDAALNCFDNPCVPPPPVGRCCYPVAGAPLTACAMNTEEQCTDLQGQWSIDFNCDANPCVPPPPVGRCCYFVPGTVPILGCAMNTEEECTLLQGQWSSDLNCDANPCVLPPPLGRCCYTNVDGLPACGDFTRGFCDTLQGLFNPDLTCNTPCEPPTGRCCYTNADGSHCAMVSNVACDRLQGTWAANLTCETPCCPFPYTEVDQGSLGPCNYPTLPNNPGHALTGIAWLGLIVNGETPPNALTVDRVHACDAPTTSGARDLDDDGFMPVGRNWMPCTTVSAWVMVTAGPNYEDYVECGGHLYLNAWKDGNFDGDFCDSLCDLEWIIRDVQVVPGMHRYYFTDPGVFNLGIYPGVFRVRLTHEPVGRYGFGLVDPTGVCPDMTCGTFGFDDVLGEVEDYWYCDMQLSAELTSFTVTPGTGNVSLNWVTASESRNDHFEIERNDHLVARVNTQGNDASGHNYSWVDDNVAASTNYEYVLIAVDVNGERAELARKTVTTSAAPVELITEYALHQNYPNPFNPTTRITVDLVDAGLVSLKVYNLMGEEVATIVNGTMTAGSHLVTFDASNLPSGMYLYKLNVNGYTSSKKMMLMK
jgi:hypothetical protein